jgi:hypothetical protein
MVTDCVCSIFRQLNDHIPLFNAPLILSTMVMLYHSSDEGNLNIILTMIPFEQFARFTVARDAGFVALAAAMLMLGFSSEPSVALEIGATAALMFSVGLLIRSYRLTEERFVRSEAWRVLRSEQRPAGRIGLQLARTRLEELLLRSAKLASGIAGVLYVAALLLST